MEFIRSSHQFHRRHRDIWEWMCGCVRTKYFRHQRQLSQNKAIKLDSIEFQFDSAHAFPSQLTTITKFRTIEFKTYFIANFLFLFRFFSRNASHTQLDNESNEYVCASYWIDKRMNDRTNSLHIHVDLDISTIRNQTVTNGIMWYCSTNEMDTSMLPVSTRAICWCKQWPIHTAITISHTNRLPPIRLSPITRRACGEKLASMHQVSKDTCKHISI